MSGARRRSHLILQLTDHTAVHSSYYSSQLTAHSSHWAELYIIIDFQICFAHPVRIGIVRGAAVSGVRTRIHRNSQLILQLTAHATGHNSNYSSQLTAHGSHQTALCIYILFSFWFCSPCPYKHRPSRRVSGERRSSQLMLQLTAHITAHS